MSGFSFIHVSDIHLGRPFSGLDAYSSDDKIKDLCVNAAETAFDNMINFAIEKGADFVFIAGDTFDSCEHDFSSKLTLKRGLDKLNKSGISVYLICGNHDPAVSYGRNTFNYDENSRIKIIGINTPLCAEIPLVSKNGEKIGILHALSFSEEKFYENPVKYFKRKNLTDGGFHLGLLHCSLNAASESPYAPCSVSELNGLNYDYYALGHIHAPGEISSKMHYSGALQGRNPKETGVHGLRYIKVKDGKIINNTFEPMDLVRFENIDIDISKAENSEQAFDIIENKLPETALGGKGSSCVYLIRPHISGCCSCFSELNSEFFKIMPEKIKTDFLNRIYISQPECSISPKINEDMLCADTGISGALYRSACSNEILDNAFDKACLKLENIIADCRFTEDDFQNFRRSVIYSAEQECRNISSIIYGE